MQRIVGLIFIVALVVPALVVTSSAFGPLSPATVALAADAEQSAAARDRDERNGNKDKKGQKDRKRNKDKKRDKAKKPKRPSCFGKKATIILKGTEQAVGTPRDDVIVGDGKRNVFSLVGGGVDRVCTGGGGDVIVGIDSDRVLVDGGGGPDAIAGSDSDTGNDLILGGDGNDTIEGNSGADDLFGGAGNDRLRGGAGIDTFEGGPGADACAQEIGSEFAPC